MLCIRLLVAMLPAMACSPKSESLTPRDNPQTAELDGAVYRNLLGRDAEGQTFYGGGHVLTGFDVEGTREPIDAANAAVRLQPDRNAPERLSYNSALTHGETTWDVFPSTWWSQPHNSTAWRWQPGARTNDEGVGKTCGSEIWRKT